MKNPTPHRMSPKFFESWRTQKQWTINRHTSELNHRSAEALERGVFSDKLEEALDRARTLVRQRQEHLNQIVYHADRNEIDALDFLEERRHSRACQGAMRTARTLANKYRPSTTAVGF